MATIQEQLVQTSKHRVSRETGIFASEVKRFAPPKPKSNAELHFNSAQDQKTWMASARTISHLGRPDVDVAENPNHAYIGIDAPDTITERAQNKPGGAPGCQAVFDSRNPSRPAPPPRKRATQENGWRHHTSRDAGPQQPTIEERIKQEGRLRTDRRHAIFQSVADRFKLRAASEQLLLEQRNALQPRLPGEDRRVGGILPRELPRFKPSPPLPSDKKDGGVLPNDNYKLADDTKVWMQSAKTISPRGRPNVVVVDNPSHTYLGEHPPGTIADRASPDGLAGCKTVFESSVPRLHAADATDQGAKFARGLASDPSIPGPGHYDVVEPVDWQRHDLVIKVDTHHFKPRPHPAFEKPRYRSLLKPNDRQQKPGPGWYEHHQREQTGDAPSAPAWRPILSLVEQTQSYDKSPPSNFKLGKETKSWHKGSAATADATWTGAVRERFETAGGGTQHVVSDSNRSEAVNSRQLREFCSARERGEKWRTRQNATALGETTRSSIHGGDELVDAETEAETAHLIRALRQQSLRNVRTPRTVRRQRKSDIERSAPKSHQLVLPKFKLPAV